LQVGQGNYPPIQLGSPATVYIITQIAHFALLDDEPAVGSVHAMKVSIGVRWEGFVESAVKSGRYGSASEAVREGLPLVEEREAKLQALRDTLTASIAAGGHNTEDDLVRALDAKEAELAKAGY
jgi:antitoxin ParD1/3/4